MSRQKTAGIHAGRPPGLGSYEKADFSVIPSAARDLLVGNPQKNRSLATLGMTRCLGSLLSLFHPARTPSTHPDPKGGAQDVRRFPTEPWMASRKIPAISPIAVSLCRGRHFLLVTFLCASKEKLPARQGGSFCFQGKQNKQRPWIPAYAGMTAQSRGRWINRCARPSRPAFGRSARFALVPPSRR
jgi:hypothetical protein